MLFSTALWSTNGASWYPGTLNTDSQLLGVAFGNATFVAVGEAGTILASDDGINWTVQPPLDPEWLRQIAFRGIAYDNGAFVAVGDSGTLITSPDGVNWDVRNSGTTRDLKRVAYGSAFAAVGEFGTIVLNRDIVQDRPVMTPNGDYITLQEAYDFITDGATIKSQALFFHEELVFERPIAVTLNGGYDTIFTLNPVGTTITGSLTISDGTVTVDKIIIQ